ncbi:hypothetical protein BBJ28_00020574 [Nothophytophthora sp. Chile5]|nr:hypothetical protein BBJ28_00020574 [Nothophytophthora sp. Chile5]
MAAACMDYVALEGACGVSVSALFAAVDPINDPQLRRQVWRLLRMQQPTRGVLCFFCESNASSADGERPVVSTEAEEVPTTAGKKRKRPGRTEGDEDKSVVVKREALASASHRPTTHTNDSNGVQRTAIVDGEIAQMSYEIAVDGAAGDERPAGTSRVVAVACEELRFRALNIPIKAIAADLHDEHLRVLEAVGRARVQGVTVTALNAVYAGGTVKRLHNCLDTLISYGLVVKRMMIVSRPVMRRLNIIHLPRFAMAFTPRMFDEGADFESDEQIKKILCAAAETYLKKLPTHSSVLSDLGRDLKLQKRQLEVLRSHILQEAKADEHFHLELFQAVLQPSRRASLEPKILNCVRYKPLDANPLTRKPASYRRGIVLELGLLHQIYGMIEDSAENGTTIVEMRNQIVLPGSKLPYKLVSVLAGTYGLKAESIILGKNKAFRLYVDTVTPSVGGGGASSSSSTQIAIGGKQREPLQSTEEEQTVADGISRDVKLEGNFSIRANKALKVALGGTEVDGTNARRRKHILERLEREKIISLSSLRASVFGMEKQLAENSASADSAHSREFSSCTSSAAVGMVDTRSIFRMATELELAKQLRLLQLPLPARNVSTKFRALRCVVFPGYEHNDRFIQGFVKNYCRDERLRRIHQNADKNQVVRFHTLESDDNELERGSGAQGASRKRRRPNAAASSPTSAMAHEVAYDSDAASKTEEGGSNAVRRAAGIDTGSSDSVSPGQHEISYRIRRFVSQQKSGIHNQQYRKLGFAYGVMYRCKVLHRFLWTFLHENRSELQLAGDGDDLSIEELDDDDGGGHQHANLPVQPPQASAGDQPQQSALPKGIVFSRETVLHSMPVHLYIQVFSGGTTLTAAEFSIVEEAIANRRLFDALPETLREKVWSHESQRTAKVLGTLADLDLVAPHKIGMKSLIKILQAGYTDGRDGILSRALKDNALGGLFRFNTQIRILLDDKSGDSERFFPPGDLQAGTQRRRVNELEALRIVGFTEKTYSFSNLLPLQFTFKSESDVTRYWEALECLCLEQMVMEVENPRRNEPAVCEVPKPAKTRARRMLRILAWIAKSQKPVPKHKREDAGEFNGEKNSGIVSTAFRPRKRRRQLQNGSNGGDINGATSRGKVGFHEPSHNVLKVKGRATKPRAPKRLVADDQAKTNALTWTDSHEQLLVEYFIENCRSRWKVPIPQALQRDKEQVAFRNHTVSRSGFGLVALARKLGKRKIDVKKRLKEKLMEPTVKLLFESAKREVQLADNPGGVFDEEVAIRASSRLTALFRRAVMMIVSPQEEYHPLVAEELISFWSAQEIRLVWRYLWLKNWIVRATDKERGRGYAMSQRLQDALKVTTLSYPLPLFQQAAEQESMVSSTLEEITSDRNSKHHGGSAGGVHHSDRLFEDDFPTNATPGQCALELGCQVLGTCSFAAFHSTQSDDNDARATPEDTSAAKQKANKSLNSTSKRTNRRLLNCKSLKSGSGFAAHLAKQVDFSKPSVLIDNWRVETKMHAVTVEDKDTLQEFEAFSTEDTDDNDGLGAIAFRPLRHRKRFEKTLGQTMVRHVRESGEVGLTLPLLMEKIGAAPSDELHATSLERVTRCLNTLVDEGVLLCVNAYFDQRYIVKDHGDVWLLRPFSLVPSVGSTSTPHVVFEGEKDTLSFPWLKMDGGTNYTFLFAIQRKLLALILQAPGITEERAYAKMDKLLSLQDIREAMSLLVEEGLVYVRAVASPTAAESKKTPPVSLFGSWATQPSTTRVAKLAGNVLAYDRSTFVVHYFPHVECIQRFGSIIQDYQNEVTEFQRD